MAHGSHFQKSLEVGNTSGELAGLVVVIFKPFLGFKCGYLAPKTISCPFSQTVTFSGEALPSLRGFPLQWRRQLRDATVQMGKCRWYLLKTKQHRYWFNNTYPWRITSPKNQFIIFGWKVWCFPPVRQGCKGGREEFTDRKSYGIIGANLCADNNSSLGNFWTTLSPKRSFKKQEWNSFQRLRSFLFRLDGEAFGSPTLPWMLTLALCGQNSCLWSRQCHPWTFR